MAALDCWMSHGQKVTTKYHVQQLLQMVDDKMMKCFGLPFFPQLVVALRFTLYFVFLFFFAQSDTHQT